MALTNRLDANPRKDAPSRGLLVREILSEASDRSEALDRYRSLEPDLYNPHQILFLDVKGLNVINQTLDDEEFHDVDPGLFYLDNSSGLVTDQGTLKKSLPVDFPGVDVNTFSELEGFCSSHESVLERDSVCLHVEIAGTLSSSLVYLDAETEQFQYRFAQGPPCEEPFREVELPSGFRNAVLDCWGKTTDT